MNDDDDDDDEDDDDDDDDDVMLMLRDSILTPSPHLNNVRDLLTPTHDLNMFQQSKLTPSPQTFSGISDGPTPTHQHFPGYHAEHTPPTLDIISPELYCRTVIPKVLFTRVSPKGLLL